MNENEQLTDRLILSLSPPVTATDNEWVLELRRRLDRLAQNKLETVDWNEAVAELRRNVAD